MNETNKVLATAAGMGASALWWFSQNEQDRNDKLRNLRLDQRDTADRLNEHLTSGDWYRLTTPAVRDMISGYATANALRVAATAIPNPATVTRPDWSQGGNIPNLTWPPATAPYNEAGNPLAWGELATAGQVQTYEETRAFLQGLTLAVPPGADSKLQIFYAAQGLAQTLKDLRLPLSTYKAAWLQLFTGGATPAAASIPHQDPAAPPSVSTIYPGVANVAPLSSASISGYTYTNPNTDTAMRFRVTTNAGGVGATNPIVMINFGAEFKWKRGDGMIFPFQPVVLGNSPFYAESVTSTGFTLKAFNALGANQSFDVFIAVNPGVPTV